MGFNHHIYSVKPLDLARLVAGLVVFGFGVGLIVVADLGLGPWDVLHQGIARHTPLSIGQATVAVSFLVMLLWIPLRERPGIGTVANAVLVGLTVDATVALVSPPTTPPLQWAALLAGVVVVAGGSGVYIGVGLGPGPRDGLMTGLARRGIPVAAARAGIEGAALVGGWLLGGKVGIGTLVFAVLIGPLVQFFLGGWRPLVLRFRSG